MPRTAPAPALEGLTDLAGMLRAAEGFEPLLDALRAGQSGTVDGAWGSSAALAAAALVPEGRTLLVVIAHPGGLTTLYGHLMRIAVKDGDTITQGQVIGMEGSTGNSTGAHLHFELRQGNAPIDPAPFLPPNGPNDFKG